MRTTSRHAPDPEISRHRARGWLRPLARAWAQMRGTGAATAAPWVEEYESRLLYSADLAPAGLALMGNTQPAEQRVMDAQGEFLVTATAALTQPVELIILDGAVEDKKTLLNQIDISRERSVEIIELDAAADGIAQISAALAGRSDISVIHIVSHGTNAELQLGSTALDASQLAARANEIAGWGGALNDHADILLYGCNVAADVQGEAFVRQLAQLTGADVAASNNVTGNAQFGADWNLEYSAGHIDSGIAFTANGREQWLGLLIESRANTTTAGSQSEAAIAMNPATGSYVITWTSADANRDGIFARIYDASGNPVSAEIQVNTTAADNQNQSAVGMAADGSFVVAWTSNNQDGSGSGVYAQRFDAVGAKVGGEILINPSVAGNQAHPAIAVAADGQFVVAWDSPAGGSDSVFVRHFSATGVALSGELDVATNSSGSQFGPAVAIDGTGNFVVAWTSITGGTAKAVFAQQFSSLDAKIGVEFRVNTYDTNDQESPTVAMAPDGRFVIAWTSNGQDGATLGVYAQRYDASGAAAGAEFRVNTTTDKKQMDPSAAMDAGGNFVIAWTSYKQDETTKDKPGIYAQRYFATGGANGGEFLVNSTVRDGQEAAAVATTATYTVIAWEGNGAGDTDGVFWQRYVTGNNPPAANADANITDQNTALIGAVPGVLANDTDPDAGATLSVAAILPGVAGVAIAVPAGAGGVTVVGAYGDLLIRENGSYIYTPNTTTARALAAGASANDVFTYTVKDNLNAQSSSTLTIAINGLNDGPVANNDIYVITENGSKITFAATGVLGNDTDADTAPAKDSLTVTQINGLAVNPFILLPTTVNTAKGKLTIASTGGFIYNSTGGVGLDAFTYVMSDGNGGTSTATVTFNIVASNAAPVAISDAYTVAEDGALSVPALTGVLANDSDANGDPITAVLNAGPTHGMLVLHGDGSFSYTPNPDYQGADSFTYVATDSQLNSAVTTVNLTVTALNDAPTALDDAINATQSSTLNVAVGAGVLSNDTDVDGNTLVVTGIADFFSDAPVSAGVPGVILNSYGTLTMNADGSYSYAPNAAGSLALAQGQSTTDRFSYTLSDGQGGTAGATLEITITGINDAPVNTAPGAQTVNEDTLLSISGISVNDVDGDLAGTQLTVNDGILNVSLAGGAVISAGANGSGDLTLTGTQAQINAALATLSYQGGLNFNGSDSLRVFSYDGALSDSDTITISINAVNDAPTATNLSAAESYTEDTALNLTNIVVSDIDSANVTVTLTLSNTSAGSLSTATVGAVTSTYVAGTGVWTASGAIADVNTLLAGVTFNPALNFNSNFSIATSVSDGVAAPVTGTKNVTGTAVNDAPTATNLSAAESYTEDSALNLTNIVVSDVDSANVTVTLTLSNTAAGSLSTATSGAVTSSYVAGTGVWTASGAIADVNTLLAGVTFNPALNFNSNFSIATSVSDGVAAPVTGTKNVTGTAVNDAPLAIVPLSLNATEQVVLNLKNIGLSVSDVDGVAIPVTVTLSVTEGYLVLTPGATGVVISGSGTGTVVLNGNINKIIDLLGSDPTGSVDYIDNTDTPSAFATLRLDVDDHGNSGTGGTLSASSTVVITIAAVNDAPATSAVTLAPILEGSGAHLITQAELLANASDADGPALVATGLAISTGSGTLVDNGNGTWSYTPAANDDAAASFTYSVSDGSLAASGSATLDILPVNTAPVNTVPGAQSVNEDVVLAVAGLSVTDADGNLAATQLAVSHGTLNVSLAGGATLSAGAPGTATLTLSGSQAQINAALATLQYTGSADFNGADVLSIVSTDSGAVPLSAAAIVGINVVPVNDLPVGISENVNVNGQVAYVFAAGDFGYVDAEGAPLDKVRITTLPGSGTLTLDQIPVVLNQEITAADLGAGKLKFLPPAGLVAPAAATIGFQVNDGQSYSAASATVSVSMQPGPAPGPAPAAPVIAAATTDAAVNSPAVVPNVVAGSSTGGVVVPAAKTQAQPLVANPETAFASLPVAENATVVQTQARADTAADTAPARSAVSGALQWMGTVQSLLTGGIMQVSLDALRASSDGSAGERTTPAGNPAVLTEALDRLRESNKVAEDAERTVIVSSVTVGAGMSVGYVVWLLRGGLLMTSLLSSLPAWRFVDPLPVLGRLNGEEEEGGEDGESLESIVAGDEGDVSPNSEAERYV